MGKPLLNLTIAVTGDFGERRDIHKMKAWIQANGGTFAGEMSSKVTHLICSKKHYKKNVDIVQQAKRLKTVKIVSFDWLEDSLMKQTAKSTHGYLMSPRTKAAADTKAKKKVVRKKNIAKGMETFEKGCAEFEKEMHSKSYSIYTDTTTFPYSITLVRANLLTNENARYALKLYVSHATPKLFACYVKYSAPGQEGRTEVLAPLGSSWEVAWGAFEMFFRVKTRREWEGRFEKGGLGPDAFVYTPPKEGQPRGLFLETM